MVDTSKDKDGHVCPHLSEQEIEDIIEAYNCPEAVKLYEVTKQIHDREFSEK